MLREIKQYLLVSPAIEKGGQNLKINWKREIIVFKNKGKVESKREKISFRVTEFTYKEWTFKSQPNSQVFLPMFRLTTSSELCYSFGAVINLAYFTPWSSISIFDFE